MKNGVHHYPFVVPIHLFQANPIEKLALTAWQVTSVSAFQPQPGHQKRTMNVLHIRQHEISCTETASCATKSCCLQVVNYPGENSSLPVHSLPRVDNQEVGLHTNSWHKGIVFVTFLQQKNTFKLTLAELTEKSQLLPPTSINQYPETRCKRV
jgi:hypothetical protein